ncbi:unnamed protein product [Polarella glacialis]|uniref:Uncharacterized protein n=1 Tax=Polarella glacialis TaxID=89957 RepID=A0A813JHP0_POLGL|nr:unnamed protein product [Polarella glacialis]
MGGFSSKSVSSYEVHEAHGNWRSGFHDDTSAQSSSSSKPRVRHGLTEEPQFQVYMLNKVPRCVAATRSPENLQKQSPQGPVLLHGSSGTKAGRHLKNLGINSSTAWDEDSSGTTEGRNFKNLGKASSGNCEKSGGSSSTKARRPLKNLGKASCATWEHSELPKKKDFLMWNVDCSLRHVR